MLSLRSTSPKYTPSVRRNALEPALGFKCCFWQRDAIVALPFVTRSPPPTFSRGPWSRCRASVHALADALDVPFCQMPVGLVDHRHARTHQPGELEELDPGVEHPRREGVLPRVRARVEPDTLGVNGKDHRHPVMYPSDQLVRRRRNYVRKVYDRLRETYRDYCLCSSLRSRVPAITHRLNGDPV
jgi:hypothetical protein